MNVPDINVGEALATFKANTKAVHPAYRGRQLSEDDFIRNIHNSFARQVCSTKFKSIELTRSSFRRMDMLNADLALLNEFQRWQRTKKTSKKKVKKSKPEDEEEPGFHFVAYVPINGEVWKLDGIQRRPVRLGDCGGNWLAVARANISERIAQYDHDGVQFNLLSLCRSPLRSIPENLAGNIQSVVAIERLLTAVLPDWKQFTEGDNCNTLLGPDESFGVSKHLLDQEQMRNSAQRQLEDAGRDPSMLLELHSAWVADQKHLRRLYLEEVALIGHENEQAARRKQDRTPMIYNSIRRLAENGVLKDIVQDERVHDSTAF